MILIDILVLTNKIFKDNILFMVVNLPYFVSPIVELVRRSDSQMFESDFDGMKAFNQDAPISQWLTSLLKQLKPDQKQAICAQALWHTVEGTKAEKTELLRSTLRILFQPNEDQMRLARSAETLNLIQQEVFKDGRYIAKSYVRDPLLLTAGLAADIRYRDNFQVYSGDRSFTVDMFYNLGTNRDELNNVALTIQPNDPNEALCTNESITDPDLIRRLQSIRNPEINYVSSMSNLGAPSLFKRDTP